LEKYEGLYPGATKLLFDNFVNQTNHRMELEKLVIQEDNKRANKAQRNSFVITITILILAAMLFIIIAFITSSISCQKERNNKRKNLGV
jgi:large-conductance mechanosensitive channel